MNSVNDSAHRRSVGLPIVGVRGPLQWMYAGWRGRATFLALTCSLGLIWGPEQSPAQTETGRTNSSALADSMRSLGWILLESPQVGPDFDLQGINRPAMSTASLLGKPTVIVFWASWCEGCEEELAALEVVHGRMGNAVQFIAINTKDSKRRAQKMFTDLGLTMPGLYDRGFGRKLGVYGLPVTFIMDQEWRLVASRPGPVTERDIESVFQILMPSVFDGSDAGVP